MDHRSTVLSSASRFNSSVAQPISAALVALAFTTVVFTVAVGCGGRSVEEPREPFVVPTGEQDELSAETLDAAIDSVAAYIVRHIDETGRFTYVVTARGETESDDYNVLRHAGTVYALGELRAHRGASESVDGVIISAGRYLIRNHIGSFEKPAGLGSAGALAIWSRTGEEIKGDRREAKLGGAGLGLVALCAARVTNPDVVTIETLRGLALTISAMQKDDGHFVSKAIEGGGIDKDFVSLYYPGEAVLGLARLYRLDPDPRWIRVAGRAIEALMKARADLPLSELPADHWLLIAIGELAVLAAEDPRVSEWLPVSTDAMLEHAVRIADAMLAEQRNAGADGSFHPKKRSTPNATRLEGLFAILAALSPDHTSRPRLEDAARAATLFLLTCQEKTTGLRKGGITRTCPPGRRGRGGEIRIDYAQHALSAFLGARRLGL